MKPQKSQESDSSNSGPKVTGQELHDLLREINSTINGSVNLLQAPDLDEYQDQMESVGTLINSICHVLTQADLLLGKKMLKIEKLEKLIETKDSTIASLNIDLNQLMCEREAVYKNFLLQV